MKKVFFTLVFAAQFSFVMAQDLARIKSNNVNFYRQPSSKAEVIKTVNPADAVTVVRKFNAEWSIVTVGTETGYIHNSNLGKMKKQSTSMAAAQK